MDNATIGFQESTKTVVLLNKDIIKTLMEATTCISIRKSVVVAESLVRLYRPNLDPTGWCLGTPTGELSEYLNSFIVDKHRYETVLVGGEHVVDVS